MSEIQGQLKKPPIMYDDVLLRTNGGYDVYHFYMGKVPKKCPSPFRTDVHPSFGFFHYNGIWLWKDIKEDISGGPIEFVMKRFSLSYKEALNKIKWDFGWSSNKIEVSKVVTWKPPIVKEEYSHISFTTCRFDKKHHEYWNAYHLSEDYIRSYDVYRVKSLAINRKKINLQDNELTYAYWEPTIEKVKILRIGVGKDRKWRSNVPFNHLWWLKKGRCDKLLICKSNKDALVLSLFGTCITAVQSENASCISEENINRINSVTNNPIISFGSDLQAKSASIAITGKTKWKHLNMPDKYLECGANDFAEVAKLKGLEEVEKHLKLKKII